MRPEYTQKRSICTLCLILATSSRQKLSSKIDAFQVSYTQKRPKYTQMRPTYTQKRPIHSSCLILATCSRQKISSKIGAFQISYTQKRPKCT